MSNNEHETFIAEPPSSAPWDLFIIIFVGMGLVGWVGMQVAQIAKTASGYERGK